MLGRELRRLARHSAIYGIGGIVSRILAVALLPVYTRYLGPRGYGKIETIVALSTVLSIVLRLGITSAFFRFYFDSQDPARRTLIVRTSFWFTMTMATAGLVVGFAAATPIAHGLRLGDDPWLVRAAFVGLWADMNYQQLTALFRVEQRSSAFVAASVTNVLVTIGTTLGLVVGLHKGPTGAVVGNFVGTLCVYVGLVAYRRYQLGLQFDRRLWREMNHFGMPLVPAALALWAINFVDRFFVGQFKGQAEVGVYSLAVRISSAIVFLLTAFQLAWPAFAYSIEDERAAKRTYAYVLTYLLLVCSWISLALGVLAPWLVHALGTPRFHRASEAIGVLAFASTAYAGYSVLAIGVGRARRTQFNWVVTGAAAAINVGLNFALIPPYGMMGAAVATAIGYAALFVGMTLNAQRVWPVPYQWRRVVTVAGAAIALTAIGRAFHVPLAVAILLCLAYPIVLGALGFFLPAERRRLRRLLPLLSLIALLGVPTASAAAPTYYLALGDSLAAGTELPALFTNEGYPDQLRALLAKREPGLRLVNLGCPGETSASLADGGLCPYAHGSQLAEAVAFLRAHHDTTSLVTLDIGANDVIGCGTGNAACFAQRTPVLARNLERILRALRAAAPSVRIVGVDYYDPFLASWLAGPEGRAEARQSVTATVALNALERPIYLRHGALVTNVAAAFATTSFTPIVPYRSLRVPLNVARVCTWTRMCVHDDVHANRAGYAVIARAILAVL